MIHSLKILVFIQIIGLGVSNTAGSGAGSGVGISSNLFVVDILLLKLLRIFSLALRNNRALHQKGFFSTCILLLPILFSSLAKWLCSSSAITNEKVLSRVSLRKTIGEKCLIKI